MIKLERVCVSFVDKVVLKNASFNISDGNRLGIVGNNGVGKTCLLKVITGVLIPDTGNVTRRRGLVIGYVPQEVPEELLNASLFEGFLLAIPEAERDYSSWRIDIAIADLGLGREDYDRPIGDLSEGWRRLFLICREALKEPDLLVLDEPTNHLDIKKIFWLENWLRKTCTITYALVSHDREFLDNCTTKTVILNQGDCHYYNTFYSSACEELTKEMASKAREFEKDEKEIQRLQRSAERLNRWANSRGTNPDLARRAKAMHSRADQIRAKRPVVSREAARNIELHKELIRPNVLLRIEDVWIKAPDKTPLFHIEKLFVHRGDRIAVLGKNGVGKTQFLNRLIRAFQGIDAGEDSGDIKVNPQLRLGYMDQSLQGLSGKSRVDELLTDSFQLSRTDCVRQLHNSGLPYKQQNKRIEELSYGQRARLMLLVLKLKEPNFYILDEPNNHLDIAGRNQLEDILERDEHTCMFVSHDRRMVRSVPNRFLHITGKKITEDDCPDVYFEMLQNDDQDAC